MSNSSSSNSLNLAGGPVRGVVRSRQSSVTGSNENLEVSSLPIFYHENIKGIFSVADPVPF
jgi:hypothetical protein